MIWFDVMVFASCATMIFLTAAAVAEITDANIPIVTPCE